MLFTASSTTFEVFNLVLGILVLALELVYFVYALLLVRQVHLMNRTFTTVLAGTLNLFAYLHFFASIGLVILTLLLLVL